MDKELIEYTLNLWGMKRYFWMSWSTVLYLGLEEIKESKTMTGELKDNRILSARTCREREKEKEKESKTNFEETSTLTGFFSEARWSFATCAA